MSKKIQTQISETGEKQIVLSINTLARWAGDATAILVFLGMILTPLWHFSVAKPIHEMSEKVQRIEARSNTDDARLNQMEKNIAVILERTQRQEDSLTSIRRFLQNDYQKK